MLYWIVLVGEFIHFDPTVPGSSQIGPKPSGETSPESFFSEYLFICDFFLPSEQAKITMFNMIFSQILQTLISHLETYLADCWDAIALFLCIHIILK